MSEFHFIRPYFLFLLLGVFFLVRQLYKENRSNKNWETVCDAHLLPYLLKGKTGSTKIISFFPILLAWCLAVFALAGPSWHQTIQTTYKNAQASILAVDLSAAMYGQDVKPNRLVRMKYKIQDILTLHQEGQLGMVAFSREAFVVSPLTQDAETIAALVPELSPDIMPVQGSNIAAALKKSAALIQQGGQDSGHIILLTASPADKKTLKLAHTLKSEGFKISVLAIGTEKGAPMKDQNGFIKDPKGNILLSKLNIKSLQSLAKTGGGRFTQLSSDHRDINYLLSKSALALKAKKDKQLIKRWQDQGGMFVLLILPLALLAFRRGWLEVLLDV